MRLTILPSAERGLLLVCFILCLAGLFAATARAQTIETLVSNTGQPALSGATPAIEAQSFTTGPRGTGYTLSSIRLLPFRDFANDSGTFVTVKEDSAGRPGALVAAFANPGGNYVPGDFFAYTAPANTILQANTTYWIVLNEDQPQADRQGWGRAASTGEDSASLPGWSIGDSRLEQNGGSWRTLSDPLRIDVRGHKNADPKLGIAAASALEGSAVRFAVTLDNPTDGAVTVQYDTADDTAIAGTDYTAASSRTLTIPAGDAGAEISIDTTDDSVDEGDETFTVTLSSPSSNADLGTAVSATGTILDGDGKPAVSVAGASATEGSSLSFTVSLRFPTDADVTVQYGTSIGTDDTASASDFTAASSETATITAGQTDSTISIATTEDSIDESDETLTLTISNPSSNAELGTATSATGIIEDDDTAGLAFSTPVLEVTEGAGNSYTVALATRPSAAVSVSIGVGGNAGLTLGTSQLAFTPTNWDEAQTVNVSADHDDDASPGSATLTHTASGGDYGSVDAELPVAVTDDDMPAIALSQAALPVPEDGSATYTVALATLPTQKVTLDLAGTADTDLTVTPGTIEIEPNAWDTPVTVTVEAAVDLDADNDPEILTYTASGGDYEGLTANVAVEVVDTVAASIVLNRTRLHVKEGGAAVAYKVALGLQPENDVTVEVTRVGSTPLFIGTSSASSHSATLTFTPDNWDRPQRIAVVASSKVETGHREYELRHQAAGGAYDSAPIVDLPVLVEEETAQDSYVFSKPALSLDEGGAASYELKLGSRPSADLSVTIAGAGSSLTVNPGSLSFTRDNWNERQTVSVTASAQVSAQDAMATLTHTGDGGGYESGALAPGELPVTIVRDVPGIESGGVTLTSSPLHAADTYASGETIALAVRFDADVEVDISQGSPHLEVTFDPPSSAVRNFGYAGMTGNRTLKFEYEVQAGDLDNDGISVGNDALVLNGATIRASADQRDAGLGGTALSARGGHRVDGGQTLAAAKLASLGLANGATRFDLTPQFDSGTSAYDATISAGVELVTVSASAAEGGTVTILPADADTASGHQVRLDGAETEITVTAARDPRPDGAYTLTVSQVKSSVSIAADVSTLAFHLQGLELTVTRATVTAEALDVNLAFTQDQDFLPADKLSRTVTIPADEASATLSLATGDFSGGATADGTLTATIAADRAYTVGADASASVGMVAANPAIVVRPGRAEYVFSEDTGTHTIEFVAETAAGVPEPPTALTFRILVRTENGTAVGSLDYERIVTTIVSFQASDFAAQDGRYVAGKSLNVTLTDDDLVEESEDFSLRLLEFTGFPDAVALAGSDGSPCGSNCTWKIVIVDDDSPPARVTGVTLTPGGGRLDVDWDPVLGADGYKVQWKSGTESFSNAASDNREAVVPSGLTTSHTISGLADGTDYMVRVIATRDGLEGTPSEETTERPDLRTLTIADATATEGDALAFTVTLSPAAAADVTVGYRAADGTATSDGGHADGADYTAPAADAELTILAGETTGTISVATGDDTVDEDDETFTVTLVDPSSNAALGTAKTATGTIEDDDVTAAGISSIAFTSVPSDGEYDLGDTIEVSVTFDAAVDVTGTPRVGLSLDGTPAADRYALYDAGASSATVLVFRKTVTAADDDDTDGVGVAADALELDGGGIVNQGTTVAAALAHAAVANGANIATRWIEGVAVTSTPAVSETVTGDPIYGPGETVRLTVTFESAVTVDTASGVPMLKFSASDSGRHDAAYESGSGGTELVFAWTVPAAVSGDEGVIGVPGNVDAGGTLLTNGGLVLNGGAIEDAGGRAVNIRHGGYTTDSRVDTTGPVLVSGAEGGAVVDGTGLVLTFERASGVADHLDESSVPAPGDFTVTVQGVDRTASSVDVDGASVTITLASAVGHAQHVTVAYQPDGAPLRDRWGNEVAGFSGRRLRNDSPEPAISIASSTAAEDAGKAAFTVTLDVASGEAATVQYTTSDGTARAGEDYTAASGTLTFAAGDTEETIEVTLDDDALAEDDETFKVTLSNASDASIANGEATGTITDDEGTPALTIADATATEGDALEFTVTLSPAAAADVTVGYRAADGTATSDGGHADGADYTAPAADAELTILAGESTGTISIDTGDDMVDEDDETFTVTLVDPSSNAALGTAKTATGTIEDDDVTAAGISSIAFTSVPSDGEYDLGDTIEVSVTFDAAVDVTGTPRVGLSLDGTPAADRYALYDAGASSATVLVFRKTVTAADDDDTDGVGVAADALELDGGGIVNQGTTVAAALAHAAVANGANIATRWIEGVAVTSTPAVSETVTGDPVYGPGETVRLTVTFENAVTVDTASGVPMLKLAASDSGRHDAAYESGSGGTALVFAWTVPAAVSGDEGAIGVPGNVDAGGTLLTNGGLVLNGGAIEDAGGRAVNIRHGGYTTDSRVDTTGPMLVSGAEGAVVDGTGLVLTFERASGVADHLDESSEPAPGDFTVTVQGTDRTASSVDVDGASVTITLASAVGHAQPVTVAYQPDGTPLRDRWGNEVAGFSGRTLRNDSPEPAISIASSTAAEDAGKAVFTVTLDVASGEAATVQYTTSDGTARAGEDYTAASGTLILAVGDTEETIEVTLDDDALAEDDETFKVTLSNASDASIANGEATGTITDDEGTPALTIADATATEGDALEFTVTLSPAAAADVTVGYRAADGTATSDGGHADGADYTAPAADAELTILAGESTGTISVVTGDDSNHEDGETFTVTLVDPSSNAVLGTRTTATGTVENDDAASADADLKALAVSVGGTQVGLTPAFAAGTVDYEADVANTTAGVTVTAQTNHRGATVAIAGDDDANTPNQADLDLAFGENTVTVTVTAQDGVATKEYRIEVTRAAPVIEWESTGIHVGEDAGDLEIGVVLQPALGESVSVDYTTVATPFALPGEDYTPVAGTLTFSPGETRKTFHLSILDDAVYEPVNAGNILLGLSNPTAPAVFGTNGTAKLVFLGSDNESPPTATMEDVSVDEDAGTMTFVLELSHPVEADVSYVTRTADVGGTATPAADYARFLHFGSASIELPARQTSASLQVVIVDDDIDEVDETLAIDWRLSSSGASPTATETIGVTGTIVDDDTRGVTVSLSSLPVAEGGTATYTVVLDSEPTGDVTVTPSRASGDTDVTVSGALTFTPSNWNTAQTVTVSAAEDADAVNDAATVSHAVAGADYGSETAPDVSVTVSDNETASTEITLTVDTTSVAEDAGATTIGVTGALDGAPLASDASVAVSVGASADAAVEGTDYEAISDFTLTISAGQMSGSATFTLTPVDDNLDDEDEALTVSGTTTTSGLGVTGTTLTITDDDVASTQVTLTVSPDSVSEDATGAAREVTVTATLDAAVRTSDTAVTVTVDGDTAVAGADFTVIGDFTVTISAGSSSGNATFTLVPQQDTVDEPDETLKVTGTTTVTGLTVGPAGGAVVTLADDDAAPAVTLVLTPASISENGGESAVTATLDRASSEATTVAVTAAAGPNTVAGDFELSANAELAIAAGQTQSTGVVTVTAGDNDVHTGNRSVTVSGAAANDQGIVQPAAQTLTIEDDDTRGVTVSETALPVAEGGTATYTVVLDSEPTGDVTVTPSRSSGDSDVTVSGALTFTPSNWDTEQTVTVSAAEDANAVNDAATVSHAVAGADYGSETAPDVSVTVSDNETASTGIVLSLSKDAVAEDAGSTSITVTGTLDGAPLASDASVAVSVGASADAAVEGTDYEAISDFTLTISAGQMSGSATFTLTPVDDNLDDEDEALTVSGTTTTSGLGVTGTTLTITDDDVASTQVTLTVSPDSVSEDATGAAREVTVTATLDAAVRTSDTAVTVTVDGDTAVAGADFTVIGDFTVTISAGSSSGNATFTLVPQQDTVDEPDETLKVTGTTTVTGLTVGPAGGAVVTLADDDAAPAVTLVLTPASISENGGESAVTATLDRASSEATTVAVTAAAGPNTVAGDFELSANAELAIAAGQTQSTGVVTVTAGDNDVHTGNRSVTVSGAAANDQGIVQPAAQTLTIEDDDTRGVTVSETALPVAEGGTATYTVVLDSEPTGDVTVTPSRSSGDSDVTVSGALTFTPSNWNTAQTVTVSAAEDADAVDDAATVSHAVAGADYGSETAPDVSVTVSDNETASTGIVLSLSKNAVAEAAGSTSITVTARLDGAPLAADAPVTVSVGAAGDTASEGTDYDAVDDLTLTIDAGATTGTATFTLTPTDDDRDEEDESLTVGGTTTVTGLTVSDAALTIEDDDTDPAVIKNVAFTNLPSNNVYGQGDVIEVSVTFDTAVDVNGAPRVNLFFVDGHRFHEFADYDATSSTDKVLVFKRVVTGDDDNDSTGVRVKTNGLQRNGGTIRNKGTTVNASLAHAAVYNGPTIDTRWVESFAVTSAPAVPEAVTGDPVYGPGETVRFTVTFENAVEVDRTDGAPELKFRSGSDSSVHAAAYETGTGTTELVFAWTVPASVPGDGAALVIPTNVQESGLDGTSGLTLGGGVIENADGVAVNIRHGGHTAVARVDTTGPALASAAEGATVDATELVLRFERASGIAEHLDEASLPAPGDFQVVVAGAARSVTGVDVDGALVTLTLASLVEHAQTVTVSYTPGTDGIRDRWGNEAARFAGRSVRNDSRAQPALSIVNVTVAEDAGKAAFAVSLDRASGEAVTVDYATSDDTAQAGSDYTAASGTLTFEVGETAKTVEVAVIDDSVGEGSESFDVTLSDATNATVDAATATGTITDNDTRGVTVSLSSLPVAEGGTATYTVVLESEPTGTVTVTPSRSSGDTDVTVSGALIFTPSNWNTAQTVTVSAAEDADAVNDTATVSHAVAGADYGSETAPDVSVTVSDNDTASDIPGRVTGLTVDASASGVALNWTAPSGTLLGYRVEASYDGGSSWAEVMANTNGSGTAYTHGSGLKAGETRHYRVSALYDGGAGPASDAAAANATIAVDGLTATGLAVGDTPNGTPTIDLCWKPADVAGSDLGSFAIQKRRVHSSEPGEWSDELFSPWRESDAVDCAEGSVGLRMNAGIVANVRYAFRVRARHGSGWALSNDAEAISVDMTRDFRTEVMTGNSAESGDTEVPATVCRDYDDPATPENDAGTFIVNVGFTTGPEGFLYYEEVDGFVLGDDVTLENATAAIIDVPYSTTLGYRVRITPSTWGQPVAVSVPAGAVTHSGTGKTNLASNVFRRSTADATDCDEGSTAPIYRPSVKRVEILDDGDRDGTWAAGEHVSVVLDFREDLVVTTEDGVPSVSLVVGGEAVQARYARGSGSQMLVFEHAVTAAQSPVRSVALLADSLSLNGGTIASLNGPSAELGHPGATKEDRNLPAQSSLTAAWVKFPPGHSGDGRSFSVRVEFSEPVAINAQSFRNHALSVSDGAIENLWQVKGDDGERSGKMWAIRVTPTSSRPVVLALAAAADCNVQGAICTADNKPLSVAASLTVPGPSHEIAVADAEVQEGPDAELQFVVTLSGTASYRIKVDYRTADGTATAGQDYTAVSGRLTFERGETAKTVAVPVLDDIYDDDGETLMLMLSNPKRATIVDGEAVGTIWNDDPMPQAWLARFGRTVAGQAVDMIAGRLDGGGGTRVTVGGQSLDFTGTAMTEERREELESALTALAGTDDAPSATTRSMTGRELLLGSAFQLSAGGEAGGPSFAAWGRVATGGFDAEEDGARMDGSVTSGFLGADVARARWLAGLAVGLSEGEGSYAHNETGAGGDVETTMTALYPYGRLSLTDRLDVWGLAGFGQGELEMTHAHEGGAEERYRTDIDMRMGAVGARGEVLTPAEPGGLALAVKSDAFWVGTGSDAVRAREGAHGNLEAAEADASRLRLIVEGSRRFEAGAGTLTPSLEAGLRHDGGDAENGSGIEAGASLHYAGNGVTVQGSVRALLAHEESGYEEWGASGAVRIDPGESGRGLSLTLAPAWGAASGGAERLWGMEDARALAPRDGVEAAQRFEAELGYGVGIDGLPGTVTPYAGLTLGEDDARAWRTGARWAIAPGASVSLEGTRRTAGEGAEPGQALMLRGAIRW